MVEFSTETWHTRVYNMVRSTRSVAFVVNDSAIFDNSNFQIHISFISKNELK